MVLTAALLAIAAAALIVSLRSWASVHNHTEGEEEELLEAGEGRTRFMAMSGILVSAIFVLLLTMNAVSIFLTPQCVP